MPNTTEITKHPNADTDLQPIRILLAESDPAEIARVRSNIDREFQAGIKISKNYDNLLAQISADPPQLLMLGRIDKFNYFEICAACHKIIKDLPIVLLSRQELVDDSFRQLAKSWGAIDIITKDPVRLNGLFQRLERPTRQSPTNKDPLLGSIEQLTTHTPLPNLTITGKMALTGLGEIVTISNNYFGALAQGNYWRKAHDRIFDEYPFIQNWSADHFGNLGCDVTILERELTDEEIQSLRRWVHLFLEECDRIIVDFGGILHDSDLSPAAKHLLSDT